LATASADRQPGEEERVPLAAPKKSRRPNTSHLKIVPETRQLREQMRSKAMEAAERLDKSRPLSRDEMESISRALLAEMKLPEGYLGWTMVALVTAFWRDQVAAVPTSRRLFLLPHSLEHVEGCPSDYSKFGRSGKTCGACSIAGVRSAAEALGYRVLAAEGSPIVLKNIVSGYVDAIVGVACLNVLEKAIDKILLAGIPCMAVPLLSSDGCNPSVDEDWITELIKTEHHVPHTHTRSYLHLMRAAARIFEPDELERLAPRSRGEVKLADLNGEGISGLDPLAATEAIAYDFLVKGGKHSRPFITLAVYDALTGGRGTSGQGADHLASLPAPIKRAALSIETFHKASLVHDDIEDDDAFRYGEETLHRKFGMPTAVNVGDYMIGMGYRLISRDAPTIGADAAADILDRLADAHLQLSEGQGAELVWRDSCNKRLKPIDALKIYALKTAPAFEAALYAGARLAGPADRYSEAIRQFASNLGVAFQILNDLKDWQQDSDNKLLSGGDVMGGRPTVLWALALESLSEEDRRRLESLLAQPADTSTIELVRRLYETAGVFENASRLVEKYRSRAEAVADEVPSDDLRRLLYYLIDTVLDRSVVDPPRLVTPALPA